MRVSVLLFCIAMIAAPNLVAEARLSKDVTPDATETESGSTENERIALLSKVAESLEELRKSSSLPEAESQELKGKIFQDVEKLSTDAVREAAYSAEFRSKLKKETERVQPSVNSLYYGTASIIAGFIALSFFVLLKTRAQQREVTQLADSVKSTPGE